MTQRRRTHGVVQIPGGQAMICTDFAAKTIETREARQRKEAEAAAAKRQREADLRKQHLATIMERAVNSGSKMPKNFETWFFSAGATATP